jgi:hypothetical protein
MKNTVIRAFVLSLTVVGFGAATVASHARTVNTAKTAQPSVVGVPMPVCPANGSGGFCGMD